MSDLTGRRVATLMSGKLHKPGNYDLAWKPGADVAAGTYVLTIATGSTVLQSIEAGAHPLKARPKSAGSFDPW